MASWSSFFDVYVNWFNDARYAQDLTQAFFARIIETHGLASADPARGRFRSYLLGAMKHFLANEWHRGRTKKRGGDVTFLDLDTLAPEARYALEPACSTDPDAAFDRALDLIRTRISTITTTNNRQEQR